MPQGVYQKVIAIMGRQIDGEGTAAARWGCS
jgi:hypothetical protein